MSTADPDEIGLEALLLAVLKSGTPLAIDLRDELHKLSIWLHTKFPDEPDGRQLFAALNALRDQGQLTDHGAASVEPDADVRGTEESASPAVPGTDPATTDEQDGTEEGTAASEDAIENSAELDPADIAAGRLLALWEDLRKDPTAGRYCPGYGEPGASPAAGRIERLWMCLFLTCLRLPREQAEDVRQRARDAMADYPDAAQLLPLVPEGLPRDDEPRLRKLRQVAVDDALQRWPGLDEDVSWLAWLAWHDEEAHCAHGESNTLGISRFSDEDSLRQLFTANFTDKLEDLRKISAANATEADNGTQADGSEAEARRLAKVDEALRGVVPIPLPQPGSWWTDCLERSKDRLESYSPGGSVVKVFSLTLSNPDEWETYFDSSDIVRIDLEKTADGQGGSGKRVWLLRYPILPDGTGTWAKGRYVAVR
jgi:hypothetical protein